MFWFCVSLAPRCKACYNERYQFSRKGVAHMSMIEIITKKKLGQELSRDEIIEFTKKTSIAK